MRRGCVVAVTMAIAAMLVPRAAAQEACARSVIFTLPGITWHDVADARPPALMDAVADGAIGSVSVRTISSRTSPASGFATIGAGARVEAGRRTGWLADATRLNDDPFVSDAAVAGLDDVRGILDDAGYRTVRPGALASALDPTPVIAIGNGDIGIPPPAPEASAQWALLAATDESGVVDLAATGPDLLTADVGAPYGVKTDPRAIEMAVDSALGRCSTTVIDHGDLTRADRLQAEAGRPLQQMRDVALGAADDLLAHVRSQLSDRDLLLIVSPTSPAWDEDVHFGVAIAVGPGFEPGGSLSSAITRRPGLVALPDVAPTVLVHAGVDRPASMLGRPWTSDESVGEDRVAAAVDLDEEAVFVDGVRTPVSTVFVLFQIALYALTVWLLSRGRRRTPGVELPRPLWLEVAALLLAAFPVSTYLAGIVEGHALGQTGYFLLLIGIDAAIVAASQLLLSEALDRLLGVAALTFGTFVVDLLLGGPLQLSTVFSYSPLVAGRFAGIGNLAFAVFAASALLTGALIVQRFGRTPVTLAVVGLLFIIAVVVDGAPMYGSDVGGALALVPGLGLTWYLLAGRRLSLKAIGLAAIATVAAMALFVMFDLSRPEEDRTHLARLIENVRSGGWQVLSDTIGRKISTQLRVARSTIWTFVVPVALGTVAWLLLRPQGRWQRLSAAYPALRAGLVGGLVLACLGFAVNDSGIVVPAMMFAYLVPVALIAHLSTGGDLTSARTS